MLFQAYAWHQQKLANESNKWAYRFQQDCFQNLKIHMAIMSNLWIIMSKVDLLSILMIFNRFGKYDLHAHVDVGEQHCKSHHSCIHLINYCISFNNYNFKWSNHYSAIGGSIWCQWVIFVLTVNFLYPFRFFFCINLYIIK